MTLFLRHSIYHIGQDTFILSSMLKAVKGYFLDWILGRLAEGLGGGVEALAW
jgi:hypothetical protein